LTSIKRKRLADAVIDEIRRMMMNGELKKGDKLPDQSRFAAQLGVSRPSLREALNTLMLLGAIEQRPGFGTVIRSLGPLMFTEHLSPPLVSDPQATLELVESRRFVEVDVVEMAVRNAEDKEIRRLRRIVADMTRALKAGRIEDYTDLDLALHYQIAEASHNRFMIHMFVNLRGLMEQFMRETFTLLPGLLHGSLKFHIRIYEGIRDGSVKKATSNMSRHIQDITHALEHYYETAPEKGALPALGQKRA
jgi:GntR family transcriptional repressor for pyruvate dehydrogenase complex